MNNIGKASGSGYYHDLGGGEQVIVPQDPVDLLLEYARENVGDRDGLRTAFQDSGITLPSFYLLELEVLLDYIEFLSSDCEVDFDGYSPKYALDLILSEVPEFVDDRDYFVRELRVLAEVLWQSSLGDGSMQVFPDMADYLEYYANDIEGDVESRINNMLLLANGTRVINQTESMYVLVGDYLDLMYSEGQLDLGWCDTYKQTLMMIEAGDREGFFVYLNAYLLHVNSHLNDKLYWVMLAVLLGSDIALDVDERRLCNSLYGVTIRHANTFEMTDGEQREDYVGELINYIVDFNSEREERFQEQMVGV